MPITTGFFTRVEVEHRAQRSSRTSIVDDSRLHAIGLKGVERMNPAARTRHMKPSGPTPCEVYVLGEAPGKQEDQIGKPFVGPSGKLLRRFLPDDFKIRFNNVCGTQPKKRKGSNRPNHHEIECYRPSVEQDIVAATPRIVIAVGDVATQWCLGKEAGTITCCRGRRFPTDIAGHRCWVYPTVHPAFILRQLNTDEYAQIPGTEHERFFGRDIKRAFREYDKLPEPPVETDDKRLFAGVRVLKRADDIIDALRRIRRNRYPTAIDLETNRSRPYSAGAKILSVAIGSPKETIAFPLRHPGHVWSPSDLKRIEDAFIEYLYADIDKVAHNAPFELEWLIYSYGRGLAFAGKWFDTQAEAYLIDEREGGMSLNFLNILHFGLKLKSMSKGRTIKGWMGLGREEIGEIDRARLEETNVDDVLDYNSLDAKQTLRIHFKQIAILERRGMIKPYREFVERVVAIALAQTTGIPVDADENSAIAKRESAEIKRLESDISNLPVIREFESRYGKYKDSHPNNIKIFWEMLGLKEVKTGPKSFSTKEEILTTIANRVPLAKMLLELRGHKKLFGTYVERMSMDADEPLVFSDGRIHCRFNHTRTDTKRLSSSDPNNQNWPSRKSKWIRKQVVAPSGHYMACFDMGQLEYRVIGMASKDKVVCDSLFNDYDVHMVWAEKIARVYPTVVRSRHGSLDYKAMKSFRGELKTDVIFPWFYGASIGLAARALDNMPVKVLRVIWDEFWDTFAGVLKFQKWEMKEYNRLGYSESLNGLRRYGPMSKNQVINSKIQCTASELVVWAWRKLCHMSYETDRPWLAPVLNIHDDLSFFIPKNKLDEGVEVITNTMANPEFDFINVPLAVEASYGPNWYEQSKLGTFRSDRVKLDYHENMAAHYAYN